MERHSVVVPASAGGVRPLREAIARAGGLVLLAVPTGSLIARMTDEAQAAIARRPDVAHCGGVDVNPRPIRRLRVDAHGRRLER